MDPWSVIFTNFWVFFLNDYLQMWPLWPLFWPADKSGSTYQEAWVERCAKDCRSYRSSNHTSGTDGNTNSGSSCHCTTIIFGSKPLLTNSTTYKAYFLNLLLNCCKNLPTVKKSFTGKGLQSCKTALKGKLSMNPRPKKSTSPQPQWILNSVDSSACLRKQWTQFCVSSSSTKTIYHYTDHNFLYSNFILKR